MVDTGGIRTHGVLSARQAFYHWITGPFKNKPHTIQVLDHLFGNFPYPQSPTADWQHCYSSWMRPSSRGLKTIVVWILWPDRSLLHSDQVSLFGTLWSSRMAFYGSDLSGARFPVLSVDCLWFVPSTTGDVRRSSVGFLMCTNLLNYWVTGGWIRISPTSPYILTPQISGLLFHKVIRNSGPVVQLVHLPLIVGERIFFLLIFESFTSMSMSSLFWNFFLPFNNYI